MKAALVFLFGVFVVVCCLTSVYAISKHDKQNEQRWQSCIERGGVPHKPYNSPMICLAKGAVLQP